LGNAVRRDLIYANAMSRVFVRRLGILSQFVADRPRPFMKKRSFGSDRGES
jgi:hypothetical protein